MTNKEPIQQMLLTIKEAAKLLSISERTLWTLTQTREVATVRIGRAVRYALEDLQKYVDANRQPALE